MQFGREVWPTLMDLITSFAKVNNSFTQRNAVTMSQDCVLLNVLRSAIAQCGKEQLMFICIGAGLPLDFDSCCVAMVQIVHCPCMTSSGGTTVWCL